MYQSCRATVARVYRSCIDLKHFWILMLKHVHCCQWWDRRWRPRWMQSAPKVKSFPRSTWVDTAINFAQRPFKRSCLQNWLHTDTQTDRQTHKQTDRHTRRQTDTHTDRCDQEHYQPLLYSWLQVRLRTQWNMSITCTLLTERHSIVDSSPLWT